MLAITRGYFEFFPTDFPVKPRDFPVAFWCWNQVAPDFVRPPRWIRRLPPPGFSREWWKSPMKHQLLDNYIYYFYYSRFIGYIYIYDYIWIYGNIMGISWECHGDIMKILWECYGNIMKISWEYHGNIMGISWECHGNIIVNGRGNKPNNWNIIGYIYIHIFICISTYIYKWDYLWEYIMTNN